MVKKERFVTPLLMWFIVILGVIVFYNVTSDITLFKRNYFTYFLFIISLLYWMYYFFHAISANKKAALSVASIKKLVKTGIYSKVRHPIYSADIIIAIGIFLMFPNLKIMVSVIWLIGVLVFWTYLEEKALTKKFKEEYNNYKKSVPKFIPKYK